MIRHGIRRALWLALRRRDRWEFEVEEEIKLHLSLRAEQLMTDGRTADDAYAEAVRRFGPLSESRARLFDAARHREESMQRTEYFSDLRSDLRFAMRTLRRQRAWAAVTVITFALGIGATTSVFSVVSSLLLHPVPYPSPERVVFVDQQPSMGNQTGMSISILPAEPVVRVWLAGNHSFETLQGYLDEGDAWLGGGGEEADRVRLARAFPTFTEFAGARPIVGRMFNATEADQHAHVAVIGEGLWHSRFAGSASVIGQPLVVDDSSYTIIGVVPAAARLPRPGSRPPDVWLPLDMNADRMGIQIGVSLVGRLKPGVTIDQARRELDSIYTRSQTKATKLRWTTRIVAPSELVHFRETLLMLTAAVAIVLLVACANVAHLQLTRAASRARELAIRATLGAGRRRLLRQLLTESVLLSGIGAAAGVLLGWLGLRAIVAARPSSLSELSAARIDTTTLLVALVVAVVSGIAFGVVGALHANRRATHEALKAGALTASRGRTSGRLRAVLIVTEMALSATLLVGATLLVRSVIIRQRADLGFDPRGLYAVELDFPTRYSTPAAREAFSQEAASRIAHVRGVRSIAVSHIGPEGRGFSIGALEAEGEPPAPAGQTSFIDENDVSANFFSTLGIRFVEGSTFTDTTAGGNQIIVNEGFARKHWARGVAVGHRIRVAFQGQGAWKTIVGVAADASPSGPTSEMDAPMLYRPRSDNGSVAIYFRANDDNAARDARAIVRSIDPKLHPTVKSVAESLRDATSAPRFITALLSAFTVLALILATVGLYGVMAFSVSQQTREIGIRVALGATAPRIARQVITAGMVLAGLGAAIGLVASRWGTKLIANQLFGVSSADTLSLVVGTIVLLLAAFAACVVPMRRAVSVDPMVAIRAE